MKPIEIREEGKVISYHYKYSDLKEFLRYGKEHGNNGWIITRREGDFTTHRGFGTIEAPCKDLCTIKIQDDPFLDFQKGEGAVVSHSFVILDLSNND